MCATWKLNPNSLFSHILSIVIVQLSGTQAAWFQKGCLSSVSLSFSLQCYILEHSGAESPVQLRICCLACERRVCTLYQLSSSLYGAQHVLHLAWRACTLFYTTQVVQDNSCSGLLRCLLPSRPSTSLQSPL